MRPLVIVGAVLAVLVLAAAIGGNKVVTPNTAAAAPPTRSDASIKAAMIENINNFPDLVPRDPARRERCARHRGHRRGAHRGDDRPHSATSLCRFVAGITNHPGTGASLGVRGVVVISGSQQLADCRP